MKVIDLLNKIANGEEVPQLIKWNGYIYDKLGCEYYMLNDRDITLFGDILDTNGKYLNDEVEIIEEPKKIEKIEMCTGGIMSFDSVENITTELKDKINELIDEINDLKEKENDRRYN